MKEIVLKLDLVKAYDKVNWDFLRLVLLHIVLSLEVTNWIMGCITSANFVVLVNGVPTVFLRSTQGLRQRFCISPLLFPLLVEGLRRLIQKKNLEGRLVGVKIYDVVKITHLIFIDDVLLFGKRLLGKWKVFKECLDTFCETTRMPVGS